MNGRCTSTRVLASLAGLAAVVGVTAPANAQAAENANNTTFPTQEMKQREAYRSIDEAVKAGLIELNQQGNVQQFGAERGGPAACANAADCAQPSDGITGFNANLLSLAESRTFTETGFLTEICAGFIFNVGFAGETCPDTGDDPIFDSDWQVNIYDVQGNGEIVESSVTTFDTALGNLNVEATAGGQFGGVGGPPIVDVQFNISAGGTNDGFEIAQAGTCVAIQLLPLQFGTGDNSTCSMFWQSSTDPMDGSLTGDGLVAQDGTAESDWTFCDYANEDLELCLNLDSAAPTCTPNFDNAPANDECDQAQVLDTSSGSVQVSQCLKFATANTTDPVLDDCSRTGGLDPNFTGTKTVWYEFTADDTRVFLDMCDDLNPADPNFFLALYQEMPGMGEGPCDLVQVACNDNWCGFRPFLCLSDIMPGETFIVEVASASQFAEVIATLEVITDAEQIPFDVPANDPVDNPEDLVFDNGVAIMSGNTRCGGLDPSATACGGATPTTSPGVWYAATGDGTTWNVTQCQGSGASGSFDTQINIYCGVPGGTLECLTGNDDAPDECAPLSEVQFCTEDGRPYLFYVHGFFDSGDFSFRVTKDFDQAGSCDPPISNEEDCVAETLTCGDLFGPGGPDIDEATSAAAQMEACSDDDVNNGCVSADLDNPEGDPAVEAGTAPFTFCGTINTTEEGTRDIDAIRFDIEERSVVTITMTGEFPTLFDVAQGVNCGDIEDADGDGDVDDFVGMQTDLIPGAVVADAGTADPGEISLTLSPGTYELIATINSFSGAPCAAGNNDYGIEVTVDPLGRCCIAGKTMGTFEDCVVSTSDECSDLGGDFATGIDCSEITYSVSEPSVQAVFGSIIGLPNNVIIDGIDDDTDDPGMDMGFGDEDAEFVDIRGMGPDDDPDTPDDEGDGSELLDVNGEQASMDFKFFGELRDDIAVVSNGYVSFGTFPLVIEATPDAIPTPRPDGPNNDYAGALFSDLDPSLGGNVELGIFGDAPFRAIVVEYDDIRLFTQPNSSNTFQIQFFEGSNAIRYLYPDIDMLDAEDPDPQADPEDRAVVIGVENAEGTDGAALTDSQVEALDTGGLSGKDAIVVEFVPSSALPVQEACEAMPAPDCPGDCNDDGQVSFGDLVSMLGQFGTPGDNPGCDANEDGTVSFGDLVTTLGLFGACP